RRCRVRGRGRAEVGYAPISIPNATATRLIIPLPRGVPLANASAAIAACTPAMKRGDDEHASWSQGGARRTARRFAVRADLDSTADGGHHPDLADGARRVGAGGSPSNGGGTGRARWPYRGGRTQLHRPSRRAPIQPRSSLRADPSGGLPHLRLRGGAGGTADDRGARERRRVHRGAIGGAGTPPS